MLIDRDLDAEICREIFGWKLTKTPKDANGENEGEVLTSTGNLEAQLGRATLPPLGKLHVGYFCPEYSRDLYRALELARRVVPDTMIKNLPYHARNIAELCLKTWREKKK